MGCGGTKDNQKKEYKQKGVDPKQYGAPQKVELNGQFLELETPQKSKNGGLEIFQSNAASVENINNFYQFNKVLGHGAYGTVRAACLKSNMTQQFAIKTIVQQAAQDKLFMLRRELEILQTLDHPNIIQFYEIYHDEMYVHFVMEYCQGGDLFQRLQMDGAFGQAKVAQIMKKIFSAVIYMHTRNIVHRDIKPDNILLTTQGPDAELKLIDFGLSRQFKKEELNEKPSTVGTPMYAAPQVIEQEYYDHSCDNWSLGVMMFVLLTGVHPFVARDLKELFLEIKKAHFSMSGPQWNDISKEAKELVKGLMNQTPAKRIKLEDAINHKWFNMFPETKVVEEINEMKLRKIQNKLDNVISNAETTMMLQKEAVRILVNHHLRDDDIQNLKNAFQTLDKDGNGELSFFEMQEAMRRLGMEASQKKIVQVFQQIHGDNQISDPKELKLNYGQFIETAVDLQTILDTEQMWRLFQEFDTKGQNYIIKEDVRDLLAREGRKITDADLNQMIAEIQEESGCPKTGKITFQMFCQVLQNEGVEKDTIENEEDDSAVAIQEQSSTSSKAVEENVHNVNQIHKEDQDEDDDLINNLQSSNH